jgi:drug/metabolite transporter (DMT)-like permease
LPIFLTRFPASVAVSLAYLYPAVTVIFGVLFLKEVLTLTQILGIGFALLAIFLLSK